MHSIIISHRNRHANLRLCVWSIQRSARLCEMDDYEIIIVDNGSMPPPTADALTTGGPTPLPEAASFTTGGRRGARLACKPCSRRSGPISASREALSPSAITLANDPSHIRIVHDRRDMPIFSRAQLMNAGIDAAGTVDRTGEDRSARGDDVLTALDADALVGRYWIRTADILADPVITKVAYRARRLRQETTQLLQSHWPPPAVLIDHYSQRYDMFELSPETLGSGDFGTYESGGCGHIYGTSQFSIRRDTMGDLRFDERYVGWGSEDMDINRRLAHRCGDRYHAYLEVRPHWAMFFLWHTYEPDWYSPDRDRANFEMFRASAAADGDTAVLDRMG